MRKNGNSGIAIIIPTLNEQDGIGSTLKELDDVLKNPHNPRYLVIDGNSTDHTIEIVKDLSVSVSVDFLVQKGKGKGQAIEQALQYLNSPWRYVVFIDGDYTYPAEYIPKMIEVLDGNSDVGMVNGNRFANQNCLTELMDYKYYMGNNFLGLMHRLLNGVKLEDPLSGLRVVRWRIMQNWKPKAKSFDIEVELNHHVKRNGFRIVECPIHYRKRLGEKKLKCRHGLTILKRILLIFLKEGRCHFR